MNCFSCGTENPADAVFCKKCGRRLDGMTLCTACGKLTPSDGEFCIYCGSNRNAPVYAMPLRFPKEEREEPLPSKYEWEYVPPRAPRAEKVQKPQKTERVRKERTVKEVSFVPERAVPIVGKISDIAALVCIVLSVLFTFLIGASFTVGTGGVSAGSTVGYGIFYFFSDEAYSAIPASPGEVSHQIAMYGAVLGTVCSVVGILLVLAAFVNAALRFAKIIQKQTDKGILGPAVMAYVAYLGTVALFMLCIGQKVETAGVSTSVSANGGTIAGIVIGAVALAAAVVCSVLVKGVEGDLRGFLIRSVSSVVQAVCVFVSFGLVAGGAVYLSSDLAGVSISTTYGIDPFLSALSSKFPQGYSGDVSTANFLVMLTIVAVIGAVGLAAFSMLSLSQVLTFMDGEQGKRTFLFSILAGVFAIVCGIAITALTLAYAGSSYASQDAALGVPIVLIVMAILVVAAAIVRKQFALPSDEEHREPEVPGDPYADD